MSVCFKAFGEVVRRALNWGDDSVRRLDLTWPSALALSLWKLGLIQS